ncbi:hypothetical protein DEO72_LG5g2695 [Vigna unguiculata]|uniref:Uncharacterized protein n=1 Tax=Vigna unguiculata TaxID=3917 RepID=A0A4D6M1C1_VIGUN|nr:hypothetical protein DEO72_LG5g2695 [Vigna unguiculata]
MFVFSSVLIRTYYGFDFLQNYCDALIMPKRPSIIDYQEEIRRHDQGAQMEGAFGYRKPFIKLDFF